MFKHSLIVRWLPWGMLLLALLISLACTTEDRAEEKPDEPATTTEISLLRADGRTDHVNFSLPLEIEAPEAPLSFAIEDLNGDGLPDWAVINGGEKQEDQAVRIWLHKPLPTPRPATWTAEQLLHLSFATTSESKQPQAISVADFNNDGAKDFIVAYTDSDQLWAYWGNPTNLNLRQEAEFSRLNFTPGVTGLSVGDFPMYLITGDWDRPVTAQLASTRSYLGLAVLNRLDESVSIFHNEGQGNFPVDLDENTPHSQRNYDVVGEDEGIDEGVLQILTLDWNHDGYMDLAALSTSKKRVNILLNQERQKSESAPNSQIPHRTFLSKDTKDNAITLPVEDQPVAMIAGDWDADGYTDLAITSAVERKVTLWYGAPYRADGSIDPDRQPVRRTMRVERGPRQLAAADLNHDGVMDFVMGTDSDLSVMLSNGDWDGDLKRPRGENAGAYTDFSIASGTIPSGSRPGFIKLIDFDQDGKLDILSTLPFEGKLVILFAR